MFRSNSASITLGTLLLVVLMMSGCAAYYGPPVNMDKLKNAYRDASGAVERARSLKAMQYAPETFKRSESLLEKTFEQQKTNPSNALLKEYKRAARLARQSALDAAQQRLSEQQAPDELKRIHEQTLAEYRQVQARAEQQRDTIANLRQRLEEAQAKLAQHSAPRSETVVTRFDTPIYFPQGSARLRVDQQKKIDTILPKLRANSERRIVVYGYTDTEPVSEDSDFESNWELSAQRAINVLKYLVYAKGIDKARIEATGAGEYNLRHHDESPVSPSEQRRVEIGLYSPGSDVTDDR